MVDEHLASKAAESNECFVYFDKPAFFDRKDRHRVGGGVEKLKKMIRAFLPAYFGFIEFFLQFIYLPTQLLQFPFHRLVVSKGVQPKTPSCYLVAIITFLIVAYTASDQDNIA
jgi:hypothetical protein